MSSVTVIALMMTGVAALVCYAFIAQSMAAKKQQKERLIAALKTRVRNFQFMLSGLPNGFLSKDLIILVQRSLIRVFEQLSQLEPDNSAYASQLEDMAQQLAKTQRQPVQPGSDAIIDNPAKLREVKTCLEELYKYIHQLEGRSGMTKQKADNYRFLITQMVLQIAIDSYILHAKLAQEKGKLKLAAHYFGLGLNLMLKEGKSGQFDAKIQFCKDKIENIKASAEYDASAGPTVKPSEASEEVGEAWDKFSQQEEAPSWKKKQVYD